MKGTWNIHTKEEYITARNQIKLRIEQGKHYKIVKREQDVNIPDYVDYCSREYCSRYTRKHTDVAVRLEEGTVFLEENLITEERVKKSLIKLKIKKATVNINEWGKENQAGFTEGARI